MWIGRFVFNPKKLLSYLFKTLFHLQVTYNLRINIFQTKIKYIVILI